MFKKMLDLDKTQLDVKFVAEKGKFSGYASVFDGVDSYNDTILKGAFDKVISLGRNPKMFENHKSYELPIGKWVRMSEDSNGLLVEGEFTPAHAKADMVRASMLHGTLDGLSIGFKMTPDDYYYENDIRYIKNISELVEISVVTFPADDNARVDLNSVKSRLDELITLKDFEDFLRESGGFSKGLAVATVARFSAAFQRKSDDGIDEKTVEQLTNLIKTL
jgi:HK97 family phage prohead protease